MKIVHLNTHSYGGAAVVARRLHHAALASGMESKYITKYGLRNDPTPGYTAVKDARLLYLLRQKSADPRLYRLGKFAQRLLEHRQLANRPAGFEIFSPLNTRRQFADCVSSFDPDVIHLHWVAGFLDHEEFFRHNRTRKFVWTLHDMNPITGGCHHADGCMRFVSHCEACPQLAGTIDQNYASHVLNAKTQSLAHLADTQLTIVSPSRWLLELSAQSRATSRFRHVHIENPSLAVDEPAGNRDDSRAALGLPRDKKIVLFVSDNLRNPRKGIDLLFAAVERLDRREEVHLVGLGQRADAPAGLSISFPGTIADERRLAQYFACADVLVSPSIAENSPLVIIEALTCGTPVVAFNVGGVPELVGVEQGSLATDRSADGLAVALHDALFTRTFSRSIIEAGAARHAPAAVLEKYKAVYMDLLAS